MNEKNRTKELSGTRRLALAALAVALSTVPASALAATAPPAPTLASATAFVKEMYRSHFARNQRWDLTYARYRSRFAAPLLAAFAAEDRWSKKHPDEVGNLDGDALTSGQDMATGYAVGEATADGDAAVVPVTVKFDGETRAIRVRLVVERGTWHVADIEYPEGPSLKALLEAPHQ